MTGRREIEAAIAHAALHPLDADGYLRRYDVDPEAAVRVLGDTSRGYIEQAIGDRVEFVKRDRVALLLLEGMLSGVMIGLRLAEMRSGADTENPVG